jgi:hypothetical protein
MQEVIASFTTVMTWLALLLCSTVVVLLALAAWHLPTHPGRALAGVLGMALVLAAVAVSLLLLAARHPQRGTMLSQLLLPLVTPLLLASLYRLSFPPLDPLPVVRLSQLRQLLLLVLTGGTLLVASGLLLLDLVQP